MNTPKNLIDPRLAAKVLFVGIDWRVPRGGVAAVEHTYAGFIHPFKFVATVVAGNKPVKLLALVKAVPLFIWKLVTDRQIRIVHIHGSSYASFWRKRIFVNIAKLLNKRVVYHCHGSEYKVFTEKHFDAVFRMLQRCDCVIALSESWKEWFQTELKCRNVVVIKNVIPAPNVRTKDAEEESRKRPLCLLFLGRLGKRKGIYDLLDVLIANKEEYGNGKVRLLFGGDGEVENVKRIIREAGIEDIASYEGWIEGEKKEQLLNEADAYVLPSYNEGLPISILEAMSYGLPIISTKVGGIPEILKDGVNGFIMEPGDKAALKSAIDALLNDPDLRKRMGTASSNMVEEHLPEHVAEQLTELYSSIL